MAIPRPYSVTLTLVTRVRGIVQDQQECLARQVVVNAAQHMQAFEHVIDGGKAFIVERQPDCGTAVTQDIR